MGTTHAQRTATMVQVMTAYISGAAIEWRTHPYYAIPDRPNPWRRTVQPTWAWERSEYRVADINGADGKG